MDDQLLEKLKKGDKTTIQSVYDSVFPLLKRHILNNSGHLEDAEDVFQEALVVVFRKASDQTFKLTCALSTYIFAVGRNIWLDRLRRASKYVNQTIEDKYEDEAHDAIELINENERKLLFQKHFMKLKADCQKILTLFFEGKSMNIIMGEFGFDSIQYTRKRKFQCKQHLVKSIKSDPVFLEIYEGNLSTENAINY